MENFFQRIQEKRAIATRCEKLASRYLSLVTLAALCDWPRQTFFEHTLVIFGWNTAFSGWLAKFI